MNIDDQGREAQLQAEIREDKRELAIAEALEEQIEERKEEHEEELQRLRHENRYHLEIIVNGTPVAVPGGEDGPLQGFVATALDKSNNVGQPPDKWTLRDEAQNVLDQTRSPESYGFASGTRLFLSLDAGVGGTRSVEQFVDPAVSQAKFDAEVAEFRALEHAYRRRGIILLRAEFPVILIGLVAAHLRPTPLIAGVMLDYTNYDAVPPSVRLVDPLTDEPYAYRNLPIHLLQFRPDLGAPEAAIPLGGTSQVPVADLLQAETPDGVPFLCIAGVREYHDHPAHTGDAWELHRASGAGKFCRLVDIVYELGVKTAAYGISLGNQLVVPQPTAA